MPEYGRRTRITSNTLRVLHLSDLHFSYHADDSASNSRHCPNLVGNLHSAISSLDFDLVIVSGDLSDTGDTESLLRAREFLFGNYSVSGTKRVGLNLPEDRVRILPGNHDAFNMPLHGSAAHRWQKSLENYSAVFPNQLGSKDRSAFEWIECDGWNAYLAFADSCFVGDPELEHSQPGIPYLETSAKGKLIDSQVKQLLAWGDRGCQGKLETQSDSTISAIRRTQFIGSLKILLMHHYLFEPANLSTEWKMEFMNKHAVFQNIALADFDMLWCGHKHVPDFRSHTYGFHMERRGKNRYLFNCLRRSLGMSSLTMPEKLSSKGPMIPKLARFVLAKLLGQVKPEAMDADGVMSLIELALKDETHFRGRMKKMISVGKVDGGDILSREECDAVLQHIESNFSKSEREKLWNVFKETGKRIVRAFNGRPFVQVLCGSATKRIVRSDRPRGFYLHTLSCSDGHYKIKADLHEWSDLTKLFVHRGQTSHDIPTNRFPSELKS